MKNIPLFLLVACVVLSACTKRDLPAPEPATPVTVKKDTIVTNATGTGFKAMIKPAGAVKTVFIILEKNGYYTTYTVNPDASGYFIFDNIQGGNYTINFQTHDDYAPLFNQSVVVQDGKVASLGDFVFTLKSQAMFSGTISPVGAASNVTLQAEIGGLPVSFSAVPDKDGKFSFDKLPIATYNISYAVAPQYLQPAVKYADIRTGVKLDVGKVEFTLLSDCGSVSGKISKPELKTQVTLMGRNGSGYIFKTIPDPLTGAYSFDKIPKGDYSVLFGSVSGMVNPAAKTITITAGGHTDAGTSTFADNIVEAFLSFNVGGAAVRWQTLTSQLGLVSLTATFVNQTLTISSPTPSGLSATPTKRMTIKLDGVTGPGTYVFNNSSIGSYITYSEYRGYVLSAQQLRSDNGGEGKVVITEINTTAKTITGTFSATLYDKATPNPNKKEVTDGAFKVRYR